MVKTGLPSVDILINGKRRGMTGTDGTLQLPLDSRQYSVLAQKSGFVSAFEQSVRITKGQETAISLDLRPMAKSAFLTMTGLPPGAQVVANGLPLGIVGSDGNFSRSLDIGDYEIGVTKDGRQSAVVRKHLRTGQTLNLTGADLKFPVTGAAHTRRAFVKGNRALSRERRARSGSAHHVTGQYGNAGAIGKATSQFAEHPPGRVGHPLVGNSERN